MRHQPAPPVRERVNGAAASARTLLREGAAHPLTRMVAVALLQAAATYFGQPGSTGRQPTDCACRVPPR
ncbi:hypothetical protein [Streptomyces sp. NPDC046727]|uniref:hypothetical protein n=1 Tax=Streptomyces sp. NPDC046727 TaxID=3155373 RepID=UPI0033D7DE09